MKTILVVDDNAICREPMAATLRLNGYETVEAANGQEALQIARTREPHLILLDVTMPVMDGLSCVRELRKTPATARIPVIMLTASSERSVIVQAAQMGIAGYLLKTNFSTAELMTRVWALIGKPEADAISQPAALDPTPKPQPVLATVSAQTRTPTAEVPRREPVNRLTRSKVLDRLNQEIELRSIKPVLEYVIALIRSSRSTIDEIASAIRQDQTLALQVLRVANSSFYQRGPRAKNMTEATQLIGLTAVRNAVIAIMAIEHFDLATESGLIPQRFWEHSLATGVLAEIIGETVSNKQTDHLFLAGLLHDIGRMVLSTIYPREYAAVIGRAEEQGLDLEPVELETFELSHADATQFLLSKWNMPGSIVEAASLHELPIGKLRDVRQNRQSVLVVALANRLAHALVAGNGGNARLLQYHDLTSELSLDRGDIEKITAVALQRMTDMEMFYATQSSKHFCNPLAVELAKRVTTLPRIAVIGPNAPVDPFSLFFKQLGWLETEQPAVAVIAAHSQLDFTRYLPTLQKLDSTSQRRVAVIAATYDGSLHVPSEWSHGRQLEAISLPCGYSRLVDAVSRCIPAKVSGAATATN